jgi:hypothetical protein
MRKILIAAGVLGLGVIAASHAGALLSDLGPGGGTLTIGDKTFSDFIWSPSPGAPAADQISVNTLQFAANEYGIELQGPMSVGGINSIDMGLTYTVTVAPGGGLINDLYNSVVAGVSLGDGTVDVSENLHAGGLAGPIVGHSSVGMSVVGGVVTYHPQSPPGQLGDTLVFAPQQVITVQKDIFLSGLSDQTVASATIIDQGFSEVPEPGTYAAVFGLGLVGFSILRKRLV